MKKIALITIISLFLMTSCKRNNLKYVKVSDNPFIEYLKIDLDLYIYISDFKIKNKKVKNLNFKALEFVRKGNLIKAKENLLEALLISKNEPVLYNNLANIEYEQYEFKKAIEHYEKSLILSDSLYISAGLNLGKTYSLIGEKKKSQLIFDEILKRTNNDFLRGITYYEITRKHLDYGEINEAKNSVLKAKSYLLKYPDFNQDLIDLNNRVTSYYD